MKSFTLSAAAAVLLAVLACFSSVNGQTTNYLLASFNAAAALKMDFDWEVEYWREWLTIEADDMGYFFTDMVAQGVELATTAAEGAAIQECSRIAAQTSVSNIVYLADEITETEEVANRLFQTVFSQLSQTNIKAEDLELFYYYHSYVIEEYDDLWYYHSDNMFYAWLWVILDFYDVYDALYECVSQAIFGRI